MDSLGLQIQEMTMEAFPVGALVLDAGLALYCCAKTNGSCTATIISGIREETTRPDLLLNAS